MITTNKQLYSKLFSCKCLQAFYRNFIFLAHAFYIPLCFFHNLAIHYQAIYFTFTFEGFLNVILSSRSYAPCIVYIKELQLPVSILREVNFVSKMIGLWGVDAPRISHDGGEVLPVLYRGILTLL